MRSSNRPGPADFSGRLPDELADLGELAEVEDLLRGMPLRRPDTPLDARVRALLGRRSVARARLAWLGAVAAIAIAAGVAPLVWRAVGVGGRQHVPLVVDRPDPVGGARVATPPTRAIYPAPRALPELRVERTVDRVTDEGIVGRIGDTPLQRYRRQSVQQVWFVDPRQGTRVAATVPRDEVVVVRVRPF
jgi:hypothetical protein